MSEQPKMQVLPNGSKEWLLNGKLHRTDGPAYEWADGRKEWWLNGKQVSWREVYRQANDPEIELRILSYVDELLT
jgi:hypothetical protein